jgi:arylsulfatase A-like enzyme
MNCPRPVAHILCLLFLVLGWTPLAHVVEAANQPNIVVILSDDGGYNEYGFNAAVSGPGGTPTPNQAYTPNLDALAAQSVIGRQAYAQPICGESRAALLSGLSNNRLGLEENLGNNASVPFGFAAGQPTIASRL